jgi:PAS domain S-box-containing protein
MVDLTRLTKKQLTKQLQSMLLDMERVKNEGEYPHLVHDLRVHQIELEMQNRELRETQKRLETSRNRYSELYDFAPVGYITLTDKGLIEQINLTGANQLGKSREQAINLPLSAFIPTEDWQHLFNYLKQVFASDNKVATELRLQQASGACRQFYVESIAVRHSQGKANACHSAIVDISERKRAEELLRKTHDELEQRVEERTEELKFLNENLLAEIAAHKNTETALRESEAHYRSVVDSQSELICRWRPDCTITFVNDAVCRYFNKSAEELIGHSFLPYVPQEDHAGIEARIASISKDHPVEVMEHRIIAPDGQTRWHRWTNRASFDEQGRIVEFQCIGNDVTEQRKAEQELKRYREHLEELVAERTADLQASNNELETFSYTIAHDLRSPLRSITGFSQILLADAGLKLNEEELRSLNRIISAGKYMAQLIDDILHLAKIGRNEMRLENIDVSELCRQVAARLDQSEPQRNVNWKIAEDIVVWGDRNAVSIIINNLLENAWKFTRQTHVAYIQVGMTHEQDRKVFFVKDNGVGFDAQYADKLFRAFERLHDTRQFEGTGIGLVTIRHIVERHGGYARVNAKQGKGATFYIYLPTPDEKQEQARKQSSAAIHDEELIFDR